MSNQYVLIVDCYSSQMSRKALVPGLIRRGNRFSVRIQVPKDLQDHYRKKEIWEKLGTEDRYQATSRALDKVHDKRAEFELTRRRLKADYRYAQELTDDEITSLGREIFGSFLRQSEEAYSGEPEPSEIEWGRRIRYHSARLEELEDEFGKKRAEHDFAENLAEQVLDLNLIRLPKECRSFKRLSELAFGAALEVERRTPARLQGRAFPDRIDPRFTAPDGQPHSFEAISTHGNPNPVSISLTSPRWRRHVLCKHGADPGGRLIWPEAPHVGGDISRDNRFGGWGLVA